MVSVFRKFQSLYLSYLTVGALLLYRRCTGANSMFATGEDSAVTNVPGAKLVWGPFHIPGTWGVAVNAYAVIYMIIMVFFSFWPSQMEGLNKSNMNFRVVGTVGTIILAVIYYVFRTRKVYTGPVVQVSL
ncbi:hypothetical protein BDW69DRAFT_189426 [Aspergillus filifer]